MDVEKNIHNAYLLQQHKGHIDGYLQSNQAAIDFSKMVLRAAMLLNGAAVIPIVYSKVEYLYICALWFGFGALLAAVATSSTYVAQFFISETWKTSLYQSFRVSSKERQVLNKVEQGSRRAALLFRGAAVTLVLASYSAFAFGLYHAYTEVNKTRQTIGATSKNTPTEYQKPKK